MSARNAAPGYGPGKKLSAGFMSGVRKKEVDRLLPVAGSSKISFSQLDKVERRDCECLTVANPMGTELVDVQIVTCMRNCQRGVMVSVPSDSKTTTINEISFTKCWTKR